MWDSDDNTALGVSTIIGVMAGICSQTLQAMLFSKMIFSSAIIFGLVMFSLSLITISLAKYAEHKPLLNSKIKRIQDLHSIMIALVILRYTPVIEQLLFGCVLLNGAVAFNLVFAAIFASCIYTFMKMVASLLMNKIKVVDFFGYFLLLSMILDYFIVAANSTIIAACVAGLTMLVVAVANKIIEKGYGFSLTIYTLSFIMFILYASPIQIAIFGHALITLAPVFVSIIASFFTATILTGLYRYTETEISPNIVNTYETLKFLPKNLSFKVLSKNDYEDRNAFYNACGFKGAF